MAQSAPVAILLSEPDEGFTGGEFVLIAAPYAEPRRGSAAPQGDAVAFAVHNRPVQGSEGNYRVNLRHGVSRIRSGMRHTGALSSTTPPKTNRRNVVAWCRGENRLAISVVATLSTRCHDYRDPVQGT